MKKLLLFLLLLNPFFSESQIIKTIAGNGTQGYSGDGAIAIAAMMDDPSFVAFDHAGNMYIADLYNNVIRKINTAGVITTIAGTGYGAGTTAGICGYNGDGGPATSAQLCEPCAIAFDASGNLYFSENGNQVVRKINTAGIITTIAGNGTPGFSGDNGPATNATLYHPLGIVIDNTGNLYFSDAGNKRIRKINTAGVISTIAGGGTSGLGDNGPATAAQLNIPGFIAFNSVGELYIPDWPDHRVRKVNSSGIITTIAGDGSSLDAGDGLPATVAPIQSPCAIAFDVSGNFYISNYVSCVIRKVNALGIISTIVGTGTCGYSGDNGLATAAEIQPTAICSYVDAGGNLYIADSKNNRIRRVLYNNIGVPKIKNEPPTITIFPNPTHEDITISSTAEIESVVVVNMMGQTSPQPSSLRQLLSAGSGREVLLSVAHLPAGVYFVRVNGVYAGKFVKE